MKQPNSILLIIEGTTGISQAQKEAVAVACKLANEKVILALLGHVDHSLLNELKEYPVDIIWVLENHLLEKYTADGYCLAIHQLINHCTPDLILFSHTYQVRDYAPRLAARLKQSLISDCVAYTLLNNELIFQRPLFQGRLQVDINPNTPHPSLVSLQAGCFDSIISMTERNTEIRKFEVKILAEQITNTTSTAFNESGHVIDLSREKVIIAIGRGIKSAEHIPMFEKLASLLGGELAASRPVCDEGWLPHERQVGSSGQCVSPSLYFAIGISGAIQHIVGMRTSDTIIAINQDRNAPIFQIADIGVIGDLFEIVPSMIKRLEDAK